MVRALQIAAGRQARKIFFAMKKPPAVSMAALIICFLVVVI